LIYASKSRAEEIAAQVRRNGNPTVRAARTSDGWTIRHDHGYSNSDVVEWGQSAQ